MSLLIKCYFATRDCRRTHGLKFSNLFLRPTPPFARKSILLMTTFLQNLKSNLTMWKLGTLPPALIAFKGHVHPIDPSWHMLGLGYQNKTNIESVKKAAVIHYNGQSKPWLEIGFEHLRPFWTKYVNYSNDFVRNCHILEP